MDLNGTELGTAAVQHVIVTGDADGGLTTVAADDDFVVIVNGKSYKMDIKTNGDTADDITADFVTDFAATVLADSGYLLLKQQANTTGLTFRCASGAQFTASTQLLDNGVVVAVGGGVTVSGVTGTADVNFTVMDLR